MDGRSTWTDCDEAGDYVVPYVLSPRDLVSRHDIMGETVPHSFYNKPRGGFYPLEWSRFEEGVVYSQKPPTRKSLV